MLKRTLGWRLLKRGVQGVLLLLFLVIPTQVFAQAPQPIVLGTVGPPATDATGRTIAFVASLTPSGQAGQTPNPYVISGSAAPKQIAFPGSATTDVSITPAGDRLAFWAYSGGKEQIGVATAATGAVTLFPADVEGCVPPMILSPNSSFSCVNSVHLTPDGSAVLYSVGRPQPLVLLNLVTGGSRRLPVYWSSLTASPQRSVTRSADVVFASYAPLNPATPDFDNSSMNILRMRLDGSNLLGLGVFPASDKARILYPTVSADGSAIAFLANRDSQTGQPTKTPSLWTMGGNVTFRGTIATDVDADPPSLSGDGSLVAYARDGQIHVARTDGGGERAATNFQQSAAHDPVISEDGKVVVFRIGPKNTGYGALYAMNADGTNLRPVYAPRTFSTYGVQQITGGFPSPGSLFTVYGFNLGPDGIAIPATLPAPTQLAGVSLFVNERPVPLLAVTPWQVNAQMPQEVQPGDAAIQIRFADGGATPAGTVPVWLFFPGFFSYPEKDYFPQAAAFHAGTAIPADRDHPAAVGEILEIYCSGLGPTDPLVPAGARAPLLPLARAFIPEVQIDSMQAGVLFAGLSPGQIGIYQINVVVPAGLKPGGQYISIGRFGERPLAGSTIFVK